MSKGGRALGALAAVVVFWTSPAVAQQTVGLFVNTDEASEGYTLFGPGPSRNVYLINDDGLLVHQWSTSYRPGMMGYLRPNGNLVRAGIARTGGVPGTGGLIEEFDWDGNLVWEFDADTAEFRQHHDLELLPDGNILIVVWEFKTSAEAIQAGRNPIGVTAVWPDLIMELEPTPPNGANVVWEWHVWDHLIQDQDPTKDNFGVVSDHPELIDINFAGPSGSDWSHVNAVAYSEQFDQIVISSRTFSEFWVIDRSTTTAEAAGHTGGNSGKGGDLLYRWGNPQTYGRGTAADQKLFGQHDSQWIPAGYPGAGNVLVFNNGAGRPDGAYSTVEELVLPVDENGAYSIDAGAPFGPAAPVWSYAADPPGEFYSSAVSGAQRQPDGTTLICEGGSGHLFEVSTDGQVVWDYVNPIESGGPVTQGFPSGQNMVFKMRRYPPDYLAFDGRDLTPGDPLELFNSPEPVPQASLQASRLSVTGDQIEITWDTSSCTSFDYNLLYGDLDDVATHDLLGADCGIGIGGDHFWLAAPAGSLYFLIVGTDDTSLYESSWGSATSGDRHGTTASFRCNTTTKVISASCP